MELERLIDAHKDAVYRQLVRVCGNYDDAEDALDNQEANGFELVDATA